MVRFIHTADWQLGERFPRFGDEGMRVRDARFETVRRIAQYATEHQVDFVVVAGDVFDELRPVDRTLYRALDVMASFAGDWYLLPGNHDYLEPHGLWERFAQLVSGSAHVHVLRETGLIRREDLGVALLAAPLTTRAPGRDMTEAFDRMETDDGLIRIGVAHGSVTDRLPEDATRHNPIAADRARRARLEYLALGDWHGRLQVDDRTFYSGTPEPDRFRGNEPGFVLLVEVGGVGAPPRVTPVRVARYQWHDVVPTLAVPSDLELLERELRRFGESDVVQCRPTGTIGLADRSRLEQLLEDTAGRVGAMVAELDGLGVEPSEEDLEALADQGLVGIVAKQLQNRDDVDREVVAAALRELWGLSA